MTTEENLNAQQPAQEESLEQEEAKTEVVEKPNEAETQATDPSAESEENAAPEDKEEAAEESDNEESPDNETFDNGAYIDQLAAKLTEADPARFELLKEKFTTDEAFTPEEVGFMKDTLGLDEAAVQYGIQMQRELYQSQKASNTQEAAKQVADAEAEVGDTIESLTKWVREEHFQANPEQAKEWQTVADFAKRTGNDEMSKELLKEIKAAKDSQTVQLGGKTKTLGHLASAATEKNEQAQVSNETPSAESSKEQVPTVDPVLQELSQISDQQLSFVIQNPLSEPAVKAKAVQVLKNRGVL